MTQTWGFCFDALHFSLFPNYECLILQDFFLPHVEHGTITLIGATTENPSFQVNNALLSRCKVLVLKKHTLESLLKILEAAIHEIGGNIIDREEELEKL